MRIIERTVRMNRHFLSILLFLSTIMLAPSNVNAQYDPQYFVDNNGNFSSYSVPHTYNIPGNYPRQCEEYIDSATYVYLNHPAGDEIEFQTNDDGIYISLDGVNYGNVVFVTPPAGNYVQKVYFKIFASAAVSAYPIYHYFDVYDDLFTSTELMILVSGTYPVTAANDGPVCAGSTMHLSVNVSSPYTFSWAGPGGYTSASANAVLTSATTAMNGIYSVTATSPSGCAAVTTTNVVVSTNPGAITGNLTACTGSTQTLSNAALGGTWSSSNPTVATVGSSTGIVTGLTTGITSILYTTVCGGIGSELVTVDESPLPISGVSAICSGSATTFSSATADGTWSSSGSSAIGTINPSTGYFSATGAGSTTITYTTGDCYTTKTISTETSPNAGKILKTAFTGNGIISTIAGNGTTGNSGNGGQATSAQLTKPGSVFADHAGNIYIGDIDAHLIRKITPAGVISNFAGTGTGGSGAGGTAATATQIQTPEQMAMDAAGNIYFADAGSHCVRKISTTGIMTTVAGTFASGYSGDGGPATAAKLNLPGGLVIDANNNIIVSDAGNYRIRKIDASGIITTIAGTGDNGFNGNNLPALLTNLGGLGFMCTGRSGTIYFAEYLTNRVRMLANGVVTLVAGTGNHGDSGNGGPATSAEMYNPTSVTIDSLDNIYIAENHHIRKVTSYGIISTIAGIQYPYGYEIGYSGDGGPATTAQMRIPRDLTIDNNGDLLIVDDGNHVIRKVTKEPGVATGIASMCGGTNVYLENVIPGGTWSSSNVAVATIGTNGVVTGGVIGGSVVISYTVTNSCGTAVVVSTVNVTAIAGAISGTHTLCPGTTATYSDAAAGGIWTSGNTSIATIGSTSGILTGMSSGSTSITYTINNGCGITTATYTITINSVPAANEITGTTTFCQGTNSTLHHIVGGGIWSSGNTAVAIVGSSSGIVSGISGGTAVISYTVSNSCGSATKTTTVTINPSIIPGAISGAGVICQGTAATLSNTPGGGTWSSSNTSVVTIGSSGGVLAAITTGTARITYTPDMSCGGGVATTIVTVNALSTSITGAGIVCLGNTMSLGNATTGGTWTSSNAVAGTVDASTGVLSGITTGTTTVKYTIATGCFTSAIVSVNTTPIVGLITGVNPLLSRVKLFAGGGYYGYGGDGGPATAAQFTEIVAMAKDATGNVYAADGNYNVIRKINTSGIITTIAGNGTNGAVIVGAAATATPLPYISGLAVDPSGNIYFSDYASDKIWKINSGGIISKVAGTNYEGYGGDGGPASTASMWQPQGICIDASGNIYVADAGNNVVRKINTSNIITTVAGNTIEVNNGDGGQATAAGVLYPRNVHVDASGNLYISCGNKVRKVTPAGIISTVAGTGISDATGDGGPATNATLNARGMSTDAAGNLYIADADHSRVRMVTASGIISTVAGTGSDYSSSDELSMHTSVMYPSDVVFKSNGNMLVSSFWGQVYEYYPDPAINVGGLDVCTGSTGVTCSNLASGGVWSSSNPAVVAVGSSSGVLTGVAAGSVTISYTLSTSCGSAFSTTSVKCADQAPATFSGTFNLCRGTVTTYTAATSGGEWSSNDTSVVKVNPVTGVVTAVAAGTTNINYFIHTAGCGVYVYFKAVTVNASPAAGTITGSSTICVSGTAAMTNTVSGGTWTSSNTAVASAGTNGVISGLAAGTAIITYTVNNGCGLTYAAKTVTVQVATSPGTITGTTAICAGTNTTLSNSASGGSWSSTSSAVATIGSATGIVAGIAAGTTTISYTINNSCGLLATTSVLTINPAPNAGTITGPATMCIGNTTTLANAVTGGTWTSSNGAIATIGSSGVVTGTGAGTANITYTITNSCGAANVVNTVSVNALPDAGSISGTGTVCAGSAITMIDAAGDGTWSSGNTTVASIGLATGIATGVGGGTATITYTANNSCGTATATTILTVNPMANAGTITGGSSVCPGNTTTLSNAITGGTWTSSNTAVATIGTSGIVSGIITGTTSITYTVVTSCGTANAVKTVSVNAMPDAGTISGATTVCSGSSVSLSNSAGSGTWSSNNISVATINASGVVTGVASGSVIIDYSVTNGCGTVTATKTITVNNAASAGTITGANALCNGTTITLDDIITGGTWSSSNTAIATVNPAGVVAAAATGTTTIFYAVTNSCGTATTTTVITVNAQADAGMITGTSIISIGNTVTLNDAISGGTWSISNSNVTISPTGVVTGIAAGTTVVSYTVTNDCGTDVTTKSITITTLPASTGDLVVCAGNTTTLTNPASGGNWTSSSTATAYVSTTGVVTGMAAGTATIYYTLAGSSTAVVVTVNATPAAITGTAGVCAGASLNLASTTTGGNWTSSANASVISSGVVTGLTAGTATISYTLGTGCAATKVVTIYAAPNAITGTANTCIGSSAILANGTAGGIWSSAATSIVSVGAASGIITGLAAGSATITYTLPGSCKTTTGFTVNTSPAVITGTMKACPGTTTTLANTTAGGSWGSDNTMLATVDAATGIVTGVAPGVVMVSYTSGAGCIKTTNVTINPTPSPIAGSTTICIGGTTSLTNATAGGLSWTSSNTSIATVNASSGVVTGLAAGTTNITYTMGTGCSTATVVSVNALPPAISGTLKVCAGAVTSLTNAVTGGTWSNNNLSVANIGVTDGSVTGVAAGTTTITYTLGSGCIRTALLTVNLVPVPITGVSQACVGTVITFSDAPNGGAWTSSNTAVASIGGVNGVATTAALGTTTISYTFSTGCGATTTLTVVGGPVATTGLATVCAGSSITLANATSGGTWSSSNPGIATIGTASGIVTALSSTGTVNITYSLGAAGCRTVKNITINPLPSAITGAISICAGTATTLSSSGSGVWSSSNITVGTIGSISVVSGRFTGLSAGTSVITYAFATSCARTTIMTVNATPDAGTITSSGGFVINTATPPTSVMLSSTGDGGGTWTSNNTAVATIGAGTGIVNSAGAGVANISYTVTLGGCSARATHTVNVVAARSANENSSSTVFAQSDIAIFPNPNMGTFTIKGSIAAEDNTQATIAIMDMAGQVVYKNHTTLTDGIINEQIVLNPNLANGMYMLTLRIGDNQNVFHFVINK